MKTRLEALAAAYPLHVQRIAERVHHCDPSNGDEFLHSALGSGGPRWALYEAFDWSETIEGAEYWGALANGAPRS